MSRGRAKLAVSPGLSVWVLDAPHGFGDPNSHAHHAIQITACFRGRLALEEANRTVTGSLLALAPDTPHKLAAEGLLGLVFVEPESAIGRHLLARWFGERPLVAVEDGSFMRALAPLQDAIDGGLDRPRMLEIAGGALDRLGAAARPTALDERIQRIIDHAMRHPGTSLGAAAEATGVYLSHSRLRHLFVEHTGLAFKTYMVWQRLVRAVGLYSEGRSLTEAAHEAGFADSAHFSRAFKGTFGSPATTLRRF